MSALTDLFSSMANKIRSKTGTATTYTPPQMVSDGIDDVFDAGVASATTSITPSDSSPVAMSANTGYKPTASGYAISSYSSVTPSNVTPVALYGNNLYKPSGSALSEQGYAIESYSSVLPSYSPTSVSANDIVQIVGSGKIVDTIADLSPSDSNPVALNGQYTYKVEGTRHATEGYAIKSYREVMLSSSSNVAVTQGEIIRMKTNGAMSGNITQVTPSDSTPVALSQNYSYQIKNSAGYLVETVSNIGLQPDKVYTSDSLGTSGTTTISVTQKPRYIFLSIVNTANSSYFYMYMYDVTKAKAWRFARAGSSTIVSENATSAITSIFTTVSSSSVVFSNSYFSTQKRVFIAIYY